MSIDATVLFRSFGCLVSALDVDDVDRRELAEVEALLADSARVTGVAEAVRLACAARVQVLADENPSMADPAETIAKHGRTGSRQARQTARRSKVAGEMPQLADLLANGDVSSDHLDVVAQALARLEPDERARLAGEADWIATIAAHCTPDELARKLRRRVRQLSADDGVARLQRQRRATTLRGWIDPDTGMYRLLGEFDPESGARLKRRLEHAVDKMIRDDDLPDTCPDDDRKYGHLMAVALRDLVCGNNGATAGQPHAEFIVVLDLETLRDGVHAKSRIEVEGGFELPVETLRRLACTADIIPVVMGRDGVALDVGRSSRLATPGQRRAMRAMYSTCGVPGCSVVFEDCQLHHIEYWRHRGRSDLGNIIPLCSKHHYLAHEGGWKLHLNPSDRVLTITKPDGNTRANPPPYAEAA